MSAYHKTKKNIMEPKVAIILAKTSDHAIGCAEGLPWHIPGEFKYFKKRTTGKPVIMGRKTYESILELGGPLSNRTNIVISRSGFQHDGAQVYSSLEKAIQAAKNIATADKQEEIFVIGGKEIFKQAIPLADIIYLTRIDAKSAREPNAFVGDDYFPEDTWQITSEKIEVLEEKITHQQVTCHFQVLEKKSTL